MACVRRLLAILKSYCQIDPQPRGGLKINIFGAYAIGSAIAAKLRS